MSALTPVKRCERCSGEFQKYKNCSRAAWLIRRYCSMRCTNLAKTGIPLSEARKEQNRLWSLGRKHDERALEKMRGPNCHRWKGGKPLCIDCSNRVANPSAKRCRSCQKKYQRGPNGANWKGGLTPISEKIRASDESKLWRKAVFDRDNYTCQHCFRRGVILNAHHLKAFSKFPELRFEISNGQTLCKDCHKQTDTYLNRWAVSS